jgi:hypothetical protein
MPAPAEFYGPLSATGGQRRAEPGAPRARQLQPLVRLHLARGSPLNHPADLANAGGQNCAKERAPEAAVQRERQQYKRHTLTQPSLNP